MFKNTRLGPWHLKNGCYLGLLGLSFSTHSRILFSSEYFHYKIFIHEKCLENQNEKFSRPGIIDARARYRAADRRLRNTGIEENTKVHLKDKVIRIIRNNHHLCRWSRGLRRGSAAARLFGLRVRISPMAWLSVFCECCVYSGFWVGPITFPEDPYQAWCFWVWSRIPQQWRDQGPLELSRYEKKTH
jgi:hypothetical protein